MRGAAGADERVDGRSGAVSGGDHTGDLAARSTVMPLSKARRGGCQTVRSSMSQLTSTSRAAASALRSSTPTATGDFAQWRVAEDVEDQPAGLPHEEASNAP